MIKLVITIAMIGSTIQLSMINMPSIPGSILCCECPPKFLPSSTPSLGVMTASRVATVPTSVDRLDSSSFHRVRSSLQLYPHSPLL